MSICTLKTLLQPEKVLKKADEWLIPYGGRPNGREKDLEALIENISIPVIETLDKKSPSDFYKKNVIILTPEEQIQTKTVSLVRKIFRDHDDLIQSFCENDVDADHLLNIVHIVCSSMAIICGDYLSRKNTQQEIESDLLTPKIGLLDAR